MQKAKPTILILGATGGTGRHFLTYALAQGHKVKVLVRDGKNLGLVGPNVQVIVGSITDFSDFSLLLEGVGAVVAMLGNAELQKREKINTQFIAKLIPAMRENGVKKFVYQAGGLTRKYDGSLPFASWVLRNTLARYLGAVR